ncbi:MAG: hypothetical protein A3F67_00750 [Verrucomicrobia bacterium RIFCSPHIGHO2_12_FULL_41_10]|nr:MAG: hypothetical protein A3F67_00750 [Verrucomicrobia bacterium RIFCSPHIGHO2_12_FULL_41_10]HLB33866.1 NAD(P)H-dependent oxidoreductase [Chthoniobacterales bacterium]
MILVISCSHHPESRSRILAQAAQDTLLAQGCNVNFLDLRTLHLPLCDGHSTYEHPAVDQANAMVRSASGILLATPIYNYGANAITKSFIEHTGKAWQGKPVGMLCAAGGKGSYMALIPLAGSLMLDFHCHVLPRHVYATNDQFQEETIIDPELEQRIQQLASDICWLSEAVEKRHQSESGMVKITVIS